MSTSQDREERGTSSAVLEWVDGIADRFESAWKRGGQPAITDFLKHGATVEVSETASARRSALLRELIAIDLEYRWQTGERPKIETYLPEFRELLAPDGSLPDALVVHVSRLRDKYRAVNPETTDDEHGTRPGISPLLAARSAPCPSSLTLRPRCPHCGN